MNQAFIILNISKFVWSEKNKSKLGLHTVFYSLNKFEKFRFRYIQKLHQSTAGGGGAQSNLIFADCGGGGVWQMLIFAD